MSSPRSTSAWFRQPSETVVEFRFRDRGRDEGEIQADDSGAAFDFPTALAVVRVKYAAGAKGEVD